jgi:hypothetical protein
VAKRNAMSLSVLAGRQLWAVAQAAETVCLHFGEKRVNLSPLGRARKVGELALQLQCWHEVSGPDRKPVAVRHFLTNHSPLVVRVVEDGQGSFTLLLDEGSRIDVRAEPSSQDEQWRLLRPGEDSLHLVFRGGKQRRE